MRECAILRGAPRGGEAMRGLLALAVAIPAVAAASTAARADEIRVDGGMRDLQAVLRDARPGDTVIVAKGTYRGDILVDTPGITIVGEEGARIRARRERRYLATALHIRANDVTVRGLTFQRGEALVRGDGARIEDCTFQHAVIPGNGASTISAAAEGATITGNRFVLSGRARDSQVDGIYVAGDGATVSGNSFEGSAPWFSAANIFSEGATVVGNAVQGSGDRGIRVIGNGAMVAGNVLNGATLEVRGDATLVADNESTGAPFGRPAIVVAGNGADVAGNDSRFGADTGLIVVGDGNLVRENSIRFHGSLLDGARAGHGIVVRGSDNSLESNEVEDCLGEGFRVVGNDTASAVDPDTGLVAGDGGSSVEPLPLGPGNTVRDCSCTGAGTCGIGNWTLGTTVTDSAFTGNGVDVVDGGGFDRFDGNTWNTGGPGFTGTGNGAFTPDFGTNEFSLGGID